MEKKEFKKKLTLNKETLIQLTKNELTDLKGGKTETMRQTECGGNTCNCTLAGCY